MFRFERVTRSDDHTACAPERAARCGIGTWLLLAVLLFAHVVSAANDVPVRLSGRSMGTTWQVTLADAPQDRDALQREIETELQRLVDQMSTWEPDSDLSRFNRSVGEWRTLPSDLHRVLTHSLALARDTGGAYDPVLNRWRKLDNGGSPRARTRASAVWTGTEMLVFGGHNNASPLADLQRLVPQPTWHLFRKP